MKLLADTHILIWILTGSSEISQMGKEIMLDNNNLIFYSFVNIWEVAIKHAIHKDDIPFSSKVFEQFCLEAGFVPLETKCSHAHLVEELNYAKDKAPEIHKDPFDRLLICQAKAENLYFVTHDHLIPYYNEPCVISV